MLDTSTTAQWTNKYNAWPNTNIMPAVTNSNHRDWVSVSWPTMQHFSEIDPTFDTATGWQVPSSVRVTYWNGAAYVPVTNEVDNLDLDAGEDHVRSDRGRPRSGCR